MELKDLILCSHVTLSLFAINLSIRLTRLPVYLPCYPVFFTSNLFTRLLVYSFTCLLTLLPCLSSQATRLLVYSFTCPLTLLLCLSSQATCLLVYSFTRLLITLPHTPRIGSIFSASLRRIIVFFSAKTWHYSKKVVSLLH